MLKDECHGAGKRGDESAPSLHLPGVYKAVSWSTEPFGKMGKKMVYKLRYSSNFVLLSEGLLVPSRHVVQKGPM